ncbi:hypothetical protein [Candidatus Pyrohabitans sp.]
MRGLIICILSLAILSSLPAYALNESNSTYINGVTFYNILLASEPVLVGETDYPQAYFRIISLPTGRGEYLAGYISRTVKINETKEEKIRDIMLKDKRAVEEDSVVWFKDKPNYKYVIHPYGILVEYRISKGNKLTIEEYHAEKLKFLNETTERLREIRVDKKLGLDIKCEYCNFRSGFSYTRIDELNSENKESYSQLMKGIEYNVIIDHRHNATLLFPKERSSVYDSISDVISIGRDAPSLLRWYEFLAYSNYNEYEMKKINKELNAISESLEFIRNSLGDELNSTEAFSIFKIISISNNGTIRQKLNEIFPDIKSVDYFIRISKEIKNRPRAEWVDVLFGFKINENIKRSKQVEDFYERYNLLEGESQDLFEITRTVYSAALQKEGISEQLKIAYIGVIISLFVSIFSIVYSIRSQKKESRNLRRITKIQIESNKEYMERLINEIKKLKPEKQRKS